MVCCQMVKLFWFFCPGINMDDNFSQVGYLMKQVMAQLFCNLMTFGCG